MKFKLFITYLLLAASIVHAAGPRFPFPNTPDEVGQNDRDLNDAIVTLEGKAVTTDANGNVTIDGTLTATEVSATSVSASTLTVRSINNTFIGYGRNRIVNGEMRFDQRNEGIAYTINQSSIRTLDTWSGEAPSAAGVFTVQRQTTVVPTGFGLAQAVTVTTADASVTSGEDYDVRTAVEGSNVRDFLLGTTNAVEFTLSFWVRSSVTGTYGIGLVNSGFNRGYVAQYTINAADTWEYKTITVSGDTTGTWLTTTGVGMRIQFDMGAGSGVEGTANAWQAANVKRASGNVRLISTLNATWYLAGVQLEVGSQATVFEYVEEPLALIRVQRYVEKSYAQGTARGASVGNTGIVRCVAQSLNNNNPMTNPIFYKVEKRAVPTITVYTGTGTAGQWTWIAAGAGTARNTSPDISTTHSFVLQQAVNNDDVAQGHFFVTCEL